MKGKVCGVLACAVLFLLCVGTASAAGVSDVYYGAQGEGIRISAAGVVISSDAGITEAVIPEEVEGIAVTAIGKNAFKGRSQLKKVVIPDTVTTVGVDAFNGAALEEVSLPAGATLESGAFSWCRYVKHVTFTGTGAMADFTDSYTWTPWYSGCYYNDHDVTAEVMPGVTSIGAHAFHGCGSLVDAEVPDSVKAIGASAFENCSKLGDLDFVAYASSIGECAFKGCSGATGGVTVREGVAAVPAHAFQGCSSFTELRLPESLKTVGVDAFNGCTALETLWIPAGAALESGAFSWCRGVSDVRIIGKGDMVDFTDSYTWSPCYAGSYYNDHDVEVTIGPGVTSVGAHAFHGCGRLVKAHGAEGVRKIGAEAFENCSSLGDLAFVEYADEIGEYAFKGCSGATGAVTIKDGISKIPDHAFQGCESFTRLTIPNSVKTIGVDAFNGCAGITEAVIPGDLTLESGAFSWCRGASHIVYTGDGDMADFTDTYAWSLCYSGCYYNDHDVWIEIEPGVTSVGAHAFHSCGALVKATVADSVAKIGESAFNGCSKLGDLEFVKYADEIGEYAFYGCSSATGAVTIKDGVTAIAAHAFQGCKSFTELTIPNSVKAIGADAFNGCAGITDATIPGDLTLESGAFSWCRGASRITYTGNGPMADFTDTYAWSLCYSGCYYNDHEVEITVASGVTSIGAHAFHSCGALVKATVANSVTTIGASAFEGCSKLGDLAFVRYADTIGEYAFKGCSSATGAAKIKDGVEAIAAHAFQGCSSLQTLTLPESLKTVNADAFNGCSALESVTIPANITLKDGAFSWCRGVSLVRFIGKADMSDFSDTYTWSPWYAGCYYNDHDVAVEIAQGVTGVGTNAFRSCGRVQSVTVPLSVTRIDANAFYDCSTLHVYYAGTETQWGDVVKTLSKKDPNTLGNTALTMHYGGASVLEVKNADGRTLVSQDHSAPANAIVFVVGYDGDGKMTESQSKTAGDNLSFTLSDTRTTKVRILLFREDFAPLSAPLEAA